ncbi:MAG: radical SAM family heme chaperone HemW [Clostridia bacterium]|nr:radical SAM family heme chaperone HemW [Clostridia bacterium]
MTDKAGLYLHIPFCQKKCRYCDFYSSFVTDELLDRYTTALIKSLTQWGGSFRRPIDTVYLGGGTPSLLGNRLKPVLEAVRNNFAVAGDAEITLELNPAGDTDEILNFATETGINRLSIGAQSGNDDELKMLGRSHSAADTVKTVELARKYGFENISLDLMLGLPFSSQSTLESSLEFVHRLKPEHISAYLLKIEENTAFFAQKDKLSLPSDDEQAEQYLLMCLFFEKIGYNHYEISNFCKDGKESRHNLKYWNGNEYLGIGPAAHSLVSGKRFYYPRDLKAFLNGNFPLPDGDGGGEYEYIMLRLRLKNGVSAEQYKFLFGKALPTEFITKCKQLKSAGLMEIYNNRFYLTNNGMLLSNSIISELLECIV